MSATEEKKYDNNGCLVVSELSSCAFFERDLASPRSCTEDCFFCKFSDFRKLDYIESLKIKSPNGILYSACHNEKNKKTLKYKSRGI